MRTQYVLNPVSVEAVDALIAYFRGEMSITQRSWPHSSGQLPKLR